MYKSLLKLMDYLGFNLQHWWVWS